MKTIKKVLCVVLCCIMAFGCFGMTGFAADSVGQFGYTLKYKSERSSAFNAGLVLDELDEILAQEGIYEEIDLGVTKIVIDLKSVNGFCDTFDMIKKYWTTIDGLLGDIEDLNFAVWQSGMSRPNDDEKILKEILEFLGTTELKKNALGITVGKQTNAQVIAGLFDGDASLGSIVDNFISINDLIGPDGISGILKKVIVGIIYDGADVDTNYAKYKNDMDSFIYGELLGSFANDYLPGFTMNETTKVKDLVNLVAALTFEGYLLDLLETLNVDLTSYGSDDLNAIAPYVNLKGSTYNFTDVKIDASKDLLDQINNVAGKIVTQMIPGCAWIQGDWTMLNDNVENAFKYIGTQSGLIPNAQELAFDEIVMQVIAIILRNVDFGGYENGVTECETLEDMVAVLLMNVAKENELNVTYNGDESYLVVLGDLLAWVMYEKFDITDYNGKAYREGGGKDCFEVANYVLNYFLIDKGVANIMGLSTTKTESFFTKIDKLLDYFGETKAKGVSFESEKFFLGTDSEKGILDAILDLDFETALNMTAVKAINAAGDVSATEFLYKSVQYALNNWTGKTMFPAYTQKPFTNVLSNKNIANLLQILLQLLNTKKSDIVCVACFTAALALDNTETTLDITEASIAPFAATGKKATPTATVKIGDKTLTQGVDFDVVSENTELGSATATIKGVGLYKGSFTLPFEIVLSKVGTVKVTQATTVLKLEWDKIAYADKYNVYGDGGVLLQTVTEPVIYIRELTPGAKYTFKIEAENNVFGKSEAVEVKTVTKPVTVDAKTIKSTVTDTTATLTWTATQGSAGYRVDQYLGGGKWKNVAVVTTNKATVKNLTSYTSYVFRIWSFTRDHDNKVVYGGVSGYHNVKTNLSATGLTAATVTSKAIKLSWNKVTGATGYQVYQYVGGKWKVIKATTATTHLVSNLTANTKYYFRVRAYAKAGSAYVYGPLTSLTTYTNLAPTASVKVKTTATAATLTWSKVAGAQGYQVYQYVGGKWVRKANSTTNSITISGLKGGTNHYFRIRAFRKDGSSYLYGDFTANVTARTLPATVSGVKLASRTKTAIKLSWTACTGAAGYQVYRYNSSTKKWVYVGASATNSFTNSGLTRNTTYQYRVRAYQKVGGVVQYGAFSSTFSAKTSWL